MATALDAHALKEKWLTSALSRAGIERRSWRPGDGVDANRRTIEAVYDYYGRLFLDHPALEWAGMAAMIGPAFYAGFKDLGWLPDHLRLRNELGGDLHFYETTFLTMQKQIFEDQAPMHEAYLAGGVAEIEGFFHARIIDSATMDAWRKIDAGATAAGNRTLLFREQYDIIDRFYSRMLDRRSPEGSVFTYLLTLVGAPSIPGCRSYPQEFPLVLSAELPRLSITLKTPLADGNIAVFANRWKLIEDHTLPEYLRLLRDRPDEVRAIVRTPISERVARYRLLARAGDLAAAAITHWDVRATLAAVRPWALRTKTTKPVAATAAGDTTIDLRTVPRGPDQVWMNADRTPVAVTVLLSGGKLFSAHAALAVMLSESGRLVLRLPPSGIDQAEALLLGYAAQWHFPADAVRDWRARTDRREESDRDYSTHVFTADPVGFVRLEFQASHHVRDSYVIVTVMFSWDSDGAEDS